MAVDFAAAIAEGLRACESQDLAAADVARLILSIDTATRARTDGLVMAIPWTENAGPREGISVLLTTLDAKAPGQGPLCPKSRTLCLIRLSDKGYPIDVFSFGDTRTGCGDTESLEAALLRIVGDVRTGLKIRALQGK